MKNQDNRWIISGLKLCSRIAGVVIAAGGLMVLAGWMFDIPLLKSVHPDLVEMKVNTALCFFFVGVSLWLLQEKGPMRPKTAGRRIAQVCAGMVILIGLMTIIEYLSGLNLGIDQLLFKESADAIGTSHPGRMAPNTAVNFLVTGAALLLLDVESRRGYRPSQWLMLVEGMISLAALTGYTYGVERFYGPVAAFTVMAVNTAVLFNVIFLGIIFARPDKGLMKLVTAESLGGVALRYLVPLIVGSLLILGWLRIKGERAGLYDSFTGTAMFDEIRALIFIVLVWIIASLLHQADTRRKQAEEEVKRHIVRLQAANKELEAFSYSVSHDLRAPLRSMDGFSSILLSEYPDKLDERGKDYLNRVGRAAKLMGQLIEDILTLSRVSRHEMKHTDVNLSEMAGRVAEDLKSSDPGRQADFVIQPSVIVKGDSNLLGLVMQNLIGNAWKFTGKREKAAIEFGKTRVDGRNAYFVRDNGAGFDMAYADKLFGAFQRLHAATDFPGTGIGLATVKRIISRHGGEVWTEGEVDKGATFYFTLPE